VSTERPRIEYYFSFISLWSYVGSLVFQDLVRRRNAEVVFKPINLFELFDVAGGKRVKDRPVQRQAYRLLEMKRWREIRGIPLVLHPKFYPADPGRGHRMVLAALREGGDVSKFVHAGLAAVWANELNVEDDDTLVRLADTSGLNGRKLLEQSDDPELRKQELGLTREAIDRKLFGAPFYFYRDEPFWGQDRLDMLDAVIASNRPPIALPRVD
jgi:2-hydroxychromene-2-carboxylate isomerase